MDAATAASQYTVIAVVSRNYDLSGKSAGNACEYGLDANPSEYTPNRRVLQSTTAVVTLGEFMVPWPNLYVEDALPWSRRKTSWSSCLRGHERSGSPLAMTCPPTGWHRG